MDQDAKIYVAGHRGLVGSAIVRNLEKRGYGNVVGRFHAELDLTDQAQVRAFFEEERPEYVFLCAARVGGIHINSVAPAEFIYTNLAIETKVIRKFHEAKVSGAPAVTMWGTGSAMREFMHIDDIADASVFLMEHYDGAEWVNIGCGEDMSVGELGELMRKVVGYEGHIEYDPSYPDGTPRKLLDSSKLFSMGWRPSIFMEDGLRETYEDYLVHGEEYRK